MIDIVTNEEIQIVADTRNLSGYEEGAKYRKEYLIDAFDLGNPVIVNISEEVFYISSSFIIGMFKPSTIHFKTMYEFFEHYRFDCNQTLFKCITHSLQRLYFNKEQNNDNM